MSKVTYLLGAGASFGKRDNLDGKKIFSRGLPVVNELEEAIDSLIPRDMRGRIDNSIDLSHQLGISNLSDFQGLIRGLRQLKEMCASYPTIDTLAKQLFVTHRTFEFVDKSSVGYERLKSLLAVAILMLQSVQKRDLRYDGFIASLIKEDGTFPPMTILSWNYDAQFELAYSGYYKELRYIPALWKELNVLNKTYPTEFNPEAPFAMIKLNGTAFFTNMTHPVEMEDMGTPG